MYKMDPKLGEELVRVMHSELNGVLLDYMAAGFAAVEASGDNTIAEQMKEKFNKIANFYNGEYMDVLKAVEENATEYTDFAEFLSKMQLDQSVKQQDIDPVKNAGFAEAASRV